MFKLRVITLTPMGAKAHVTAHGFSVTVSFKAGSASPISNESFTDLPTNVTACALANVTLDPNAILSSVGTVLF